jgi:aminoglycoside phosphotransferase (APT) family kinase protein
MTAAQACEQGGLTELIRRMAAFHAWGESQVAEPSWGFLTQYDEAYYTHWLDLTCALARPMAQEFPWLDQVATAYRERIPLLTRRPQTIIHGELTTRNTLWADGRIMVIDWETAAVGPAEVDLALFTFDWDLDDVRSLEASYVQARWQGSPPAGFDDVMLAARLYVAYHWIFSSPDGRDEARVRSHLETVQRKAARWGIIPASYLIP